MTKNMIWVHDNQRLIAYNRKKDGTIKEKGALIRTCNSPFTSMTYCNGVIISGHM
jgi:hypothetical protein